MTIARATSLAVLLLMAPVAATAELKEVKEVGILDASRAKADEKDSALLWYDVQLLPIEGQGWTETKSDYDRLPARAEEKVRAAVWVLSQHSAGIAVRFVTDATTIHARWTLTSDRLAMPHMAATGVSGLDFYVGDLENKWRWLACARPTDQTNTSKVISGIPEGRRTYLMYLPLYNGVATAEIGIAKDRTLGAAPSRPEGSQKPIVFYGTSITHGACASRPGMAHPAILGRRFDRPVINLGFSGNGKMETEVVELMAELDAAVYVIDCLPNTTAQEIQTRTKPCLKILRHAHPRTPILLVEDRTYADSFLVTAKRERNRTSRQALRQVYEEFKAAGEKYLYYLEGERLLGDDHEGTVDSSHPTDLGFMRQADVMAEVLGPILTANGR